MSDFSLFGALTCGMNRYLPFIERGTTGSVSFREKSQKTSRFTFLWYGVGVSIAFFSIVVRLFNLSVVNGSYYNVLAEDNRIREVVIEAPRGTIYDRLGYILAENTIPDFDLQADRITSSRIYANAEAVSHVLGYRQIADTSDLEKDSCAYKLKQGDKTGKKGIEYLYECELRGAKGKKLIEVDAMGRAVKTLDMVPPVKGSDIHLALDTELQILAHDLLRNKHGAIVATRPQTGEVLVLESSPGFDPQVFENGDAKAMQALLLNEEKPLFNRALEGNYPPASTFKMILATAGLEEGVITPDETIMDNGFLEAGPRKFHNWYFLEYGRTEGEVDMVKSLQRSNDIYYYLLGGKLGPERIKRWAELFGFQNKSGIGLNENAGIIPTSFWKEQVLKERWYLGDTYNLSIGQGYVTATPLQVTYATAAFANNGYLCTPQLLKSNSLEARNCTKIPMSEATYNVVRQGMKAACEPGGTGHPLFNFRVGSSEQVITKPQENGEATGEASLVFTGTPISIGCKTGTAESHAESGRPHAWFTAFAPFESPEIALTVLVEEGGQGSDVAAPIAKKLLELYFSRTQ